MEEGIGKLQEQDRDTLMAIGQCAVIVFVFLCLYLYLCRALPGKVAEHGRDALGSVQAV